MEVDNVFLGTPIWLHAAAETTMSFITPKFANVIGPYSSSALSEVLLCKSVAEFKL